MKFQEISLTPNNIKEIARLYSETYKTKITPKEVKEFTETKKIKHYGKIQGTKITCLISIRVLKKSDMNPIMSKYVKTQTAPFVSNIISTKPGCGRELLKFAANLFKGQDLFLNSIDKGTKEFYKKVGFTELPSNNPRFHPFIYHAGGILEEAILKIEQLIEEAIYAAYGEAHDHRKEVDQIRQKVIREKPNIIIHELDFEDRAFYKKHLPNTKVIALEPKNINRRKYPKDLKKQFLIRENEMIDTLKKYINSSKNIIIIVGDTHLRENGLEIGPNFLTQFLKKNNVKIIRSKHKEIK
jgi:hypothetical protein